MWALSGAGVGVVRFRERLKAVEKARTWGFLRYAERISTESIPSLRRWAQACPLLDRNAHVTRLHGKLIDNPTSLKIQPYTPPSAVA